MDNNESLNPEAKIADMFSEYAKQGLASLGATYADHTKIPDLDIFEVSNDVRGRKLSVRIQGTNPVFEVALINACGHVSRDIIRGAIKDFDQNTTTAEFILAQ